MGRAGGRGSASLRRVDRVGEPEVEQHDAPARSAHHVGGLDVAMDQAERVDRRERAADLDADARRLVGRPHAALFDQLLQRDAIDQLEAELEAALALLDRVDADHVLAVTAREHARLAQELRSLLLGELVVDEDLERHLATERAVARAPDAAEGPATDLLEELESADQVGRGRCGARVARLSLGDVAHGRERPRGAQLPGTEASGRLHPLPVDRRAVGDRADQLGEGVSFLHHGRPSPWRPRRARA